VFSQEIEQQRRQMSMLQRLGDGAIPRAEPAAAAPMRKHNQSVRLSRQAEVAIQRHAGKVQPNGTRRRGFSRDSHAHLRQVSPDE